MKALSYALLLFAPIVFGFGLPQCDEWQWSSNKPPVFRLNHVTWKMGAWYAVSDSGNALVSENGENWEVLLTGQQNYLKGIDRNENLIVASGNQGTLLVSDDEGESWTTIDLGTTDPLWSVFWDGSRFLVGGSHEIYSSVDGISWSPSALPTIDVARELMKTDNYILVQGNSIHTSIDGENWDLRLQGSQFQDLHWNGSFYTVIAYNGTVYTSPDAIAWNTISSGFFGLQSITSIGSTLVAVGNSGLIITSPDGTSWTQQTIPGLTKNLNGIASNDCCGLTVGDNGVITYSMDSVGWEVVRGDFELYFDSAVWINNQYIILGQGGNIMTSPDGKVWTALNTGVTEWLKEIAWNGSRYVVVGGDATIITSEDLTTWTPRTANIPQVSGITPTLESVTWGNGQFVGVGWFGTIITSPDGVTWEIQTPPSTTHSINRVYWFDGFYLATANSGHLYYSVDGQFWEDRPTGLTGVGDHLTAAVRTDDAWFVVGWDLITLKSTDGYHWNLIYSNPIRDMVDVVWIGNQMVACTKTATIEYSTDGNSWTPQYTGVGHLRRITHNGSEFVTVGLQNAILKSQCPFCTNVDLFTLYPDWPDFTIAQLVQSVNDQCP